MKTKRQKTIFIILTMWALSFGSPEEIERILNLPEEKIDIGYSFLVLSKDAFPDYDIKNGMQIFDNITKRMTQFLGMFSEDVSIPDNRIGILNTFLFRKGSWNNAGNGKFIVYEYDLASVDTVQPAALFLVHALATLKGTCSSLPMLWAVIADRLGWPVKAVRMPGHIFLRYEGAAHANIDPTSYGGFFPDSQYIEDFKISSNALKKGVYMRSLSKKEFISTLLVNNAYYCIQINDVTRAIKYLQLAIASDSTNADAIANLAKILKDEKMLSKAKTMGFSRGYSESFIKKQQESVNKQKKGIKPL